MEWQEHSLNIINALAIQILIIDRDYNIVGANHSAYRSFKLSTNNIIGNKCFKVTHEISRPCWYEGVCCPTKTAFEHKKKIKVLQEHIYNGKTVLEQIIVSPLLNDHCEVDFIVEELNDITELIQSKEIIDHLIKDVKTLKGLLPICAKCKNIRDDKGYWSKIEDYISNHSDVLFSHGLCEKCCEELYSEDEWYKNMKEEEKKENASSLVLHSTYYIFAERTGELYRMDQILLSI